MEKSTIRAYQGILKSWRFIEPSGFPEDFAQKRFAKKFEEPNDEKAEKRASDCWSSFIAFDSTLPSRICLPSGEWYKARHLIHMWCRSMSFGDIDFPKGSSFVPSRGQNSIESRLSRGAWTCTVENFDRFARVIYDHKALKRAFRRRYNHWYRKQGFSETRRESDNLLFRRLGAHGAYLWKLRRITDFVRGSRFSTIPKNNKEDRPINVEPIGNILVQRSLGNGLKRMLAAEVDIDLDLLAEQHANRIRSRDVATIDLKSASDAVSIALVEFLFPRKWFKAFMESRSPMLYGGDNEYHVPKKISSMGNGFTFELMSTILNAIARVLDPEATVFGDDVIIRKTSANRFIELIEEVGFCVNRDKSFVDGPFRESCGANFHDDYGYVKSYDFRWPESINDCAQILNKAYALRDYASFELLYDRLLRATPKALHGGGFNASCIKRYNAEREIDDLPTYFVANASRRAGKQTQLLIKELSERFQVNASEFRSFNAYKFVSKLASPTRDHLNLNWHWAKYEMYLSAGMVSKDIITGEGRWVQVPVLEYQGSIIMESTLKAQLRAERGYRKNALRKLVSVISRLL